jgi:hypothetical protein
LRAENRLASAFEEFILPYDALRTAASDAALLELHKGETSFDREAIERNRRSSVFNHPIGARPTPQCSRGSMQLPSERIQDGCFELASFKRTAKPITYILISLMRTCTPLGTKSWKGRRSDAGRSQPARRLSLGLVHCPVRHRHATKSWKDRLSTAGRSQPTQRLSLAAGTARCTTAPRAGAKSLIFNYSSSLINPLRASYSSPVHSDEKSSGPRRFTASWTEI